MIALYGCSCSTWTTSHRHAEGLGLSLRLAEMPRGGSLGMLCHIQSVFRELLAVGRYGMKRLDNGNHGNLRASIAGEAHTAFDS